MLLGDGCLSKNKNNVYFSIIHGQQQKDYIEWKRQLFEQVTKSEVKLLMSYVKCQGKTFERYKFQKGMKRFRTWRKFFYPNDKKDASKIIKYIRHPELAMAIWLMDDGTVNYNKKNRSTSLRIHTDSETITSVENLIVWINSAFNVNAKIYMRKYGSKHNFKQHPTIRFNTNDMLKIWSVVRELCLKFKSMQHKFRNLETLYQNRLLQRTPVNTD